MREKLFRIAANNKNQYLEFTQKHKDYLPTDGEMIERKDGWLRAQLVDLDELDEYSSAIRQIFTYELNLIHGEHFGCCSRYVDCSDAKKCIHPEFVFSLSCHYRINLLDNKIFYGANRNI